jgi:tetratricopeptide (TPR) repeat protein
MPRPASATGIPAALTTIGDRYRIERLLGRGGMGEVLAVTEVATSKPFALKRLLPGADARHAAALAREYHRLASLKHPNVVQVFDFGISEGSPYYTMELLSGSDVESLAPLEWSAVVPILRDVASALAVLHARSLVHRDVSARNVWRTSEGAIKLIDFGTMTSFGVSNQLAGTLPYLPPEALRSRLLDQRSDLYSLGALGYQLLTGHHAYPARSVADLEQHWAHGLRSPSARVGALARADLAELPEALDQLIEALMASDPEARPAHAADVLDRLHAILPSEDSHGERAVAGILTSAAFAGRASERALLLGLLQQTLSGRGAAALLLGPRGIGRSRMLRELAVEARIADAAVIALEEEQERGALSAAARVLLATLEALPVIAHEAAAAQASVLGHLSDDVRRALNVEAGQLEQFPELVGEARVRMQTALHAFFLEITAHRPLVLLVDDLQSIDEASVAFFATLARAADGTRLLIVATARSDGGHAAPPVAKPFASNAQSVVLSGLSAEESHEMLRSIFGDAQQLPRTAAHLWERAEGNPGQLMELCEYLVHGDKIRFVDGLWVLPMQVGDLALPASLSAMDEARLERIADEARRLADALSVLEEAAPLALCSKLSPLAPARTFSALDELCAAGILVYGSQGYSFRSEELRALLLKSLEGERATRAQLAAGEALLARDAPPVGDRLRAGVHLLRGGELKRGAEIVHRVVVEALEHMNEDNVQSAALVEQAYAQASKLGLSQHERLSFLSLLAWAGYFLDRRLAATYGEEALACGQEVCGMNLARKLSPWLGRKLGLFAALFIAAARIRRLSKHSALVPNLKSSFSFFLAAAGALSGTHALCMARDKILACALAIEPLTALGPNHVASIVHRFTLGCAALLNDNFGTVGAHWEALTARLEDAAPIAGMSDSTRLYYRAASLYCWGSSEVWRDKSRTLELADRVEKQPIKLYQVSADQLRAVYYESQGKLAQAARHRSRVETRALQRGATWQVEIWGPASTVSTAIRQNDAVAVKRAWGQLRHLAADSATLREYVSIARSAHLTMRRRYHEALELTERLANNHPSDAIGHSNLVAGLALTYSALGRFADAERVASAAVERLTAEDRAVPGLAHRVQIELALAQAGMGRHEEAATRLDAMIARHAPEEGPLTLGALYDARAKVARYANDAAAEETYVALMERWYRSTECPSLLQYCDRLARRRLKHEEHPHAPFRDLTATSSAFSSYETSIEPEAGTAAVIAKLIDLTSASQWVLYRYDAATGDKIVESSNAPISEELTGWIDARMGASIDYVTHTVDIDHAQPAVQESTISVGDERWQLALVPDNDGTMLGVIALCNARKPPTMDGLLALGRQLERRRT